METAPFFVGGPIPTALSADYLYGFEEERRTIAQYLNRRTQSRLGIFGPPGSGKTSLVLSVTPNVALPRTHLDCSRIWPSNPPGFYRLLGEALGLPRTQEPPKGAPATVYPGLPLPTKLPRGILVLDNAHELADIDADLLRELPLFTVRVPHHIVLTGQREPLESYCEAAMELKPFSEATAGHFLRQRFARAGILLEDDAIPVFFEFTRGAPEPLQHLAYLAWERARLDGRRSIRPIDVESAVTDLVESLPTRTLTGWSAVRGLMRDLFIAMCLYDLESPTDIARRLDLEPKNVIVLLGRLQSAHGLIERVERGTYRVHDPLLKHYVRKEWGSPILR